MRIAIIKEVNQIIEIFRFISIPNNLQIRQEEYLMIMNK